MRIGLLHVVQLASLSMAAFMLTTANVQAGSRNIPTYERDRADFEDKVVKRLQPDSGLNGRYKFGQLGVLLPSYDRESLYLAYRALILDKQKLEKQEQSTPEYVLKSDIPDGGIDTWTAQRASVSEQAPRRPLEQYRSFTGYAYGNYLNCADGAYNLAAETLQSLKSNNKISKTAVQEWLAAQDAVFDLCGGPDSNAKPATKIPPELPATAGLYLRQLRQYQIATAYFYDANLSVALQRFDAIAADKSSPMSAWASHAGLRSLLRMGSLDDSLEKRMGEIRASDNTREQKLHAYHLTLAEKQRKMAQIYAQIQARAKLILADKSRSKQHQAVQKLLTQAALYIVPEQVYAELSGVLGRFDRDVQVSGQLSSWATLGNKLFDFGANRDLLASLRKQYEYFDWIRSIQACTDNPASPNHTGQCAQEHQHALAEWQRTKANTWLVAILMTATTLTPQVEATFAPALQANRESKEYLTARYYIARLLRQAGRRDEAIAVIRPVLSIDGNTIPSIMLADAASANNLFRQEMLAMAKTEAEALPYLIRHAEVRIGADVDELLNRRLFSDDLLRLANNPATDSRIVDQLLMAAWWRADMAGKPATAEAAARKLLPSQPAMAAGINAYLATKDAELRHYYLARLALVFRISPQVYRVNKNLGGEINKIQPPDWWCSFSDEDFKAQARIQRIAPTGLDFTYDLVGREAEFRKLRQIGTGADWLARIALQRAKTIPNDPALPFMLDAVIKSEELDCISAESNALVNATRQARASLPATKPAVTAKPGISEEVLRETYEKEKARIAGKHEYLVSHIMLKSEEEAKQVLAKIKNGTRFEDIARQVSLDTGSRDKGGELPWSLAENYSKNFANAITSMNGNGLYLTPIKTEYGWHVLEVRGKRSLQLPPFEKIRGYLEEQMLKNRK